MKFYLMINVKFDHDLVYTTHFVAAENIISYPFQEQSTYYIHVPVFYLNFICIFKYGMCNYFFDEFLNWAHMKSITYPYTTPAETQGYYMYMKYMCSKVQKNNPHFLHFTYRRCLAVFVAITYQKWHY